jgi:hypothetical protein
MNVHLLVWILVPAAVIRVRVCGEGADARPGPTLIPQGNSQ